MADTLTVRVYNVRFGDAVLVTVPDRDSSKKTTKRRILIDVGNAPLVASREGGDDAVFKPVIDDILDQLDGDPLDLYVMTHEHLDHVQGLPHAAWKLYPNDFAQRFRVSSVWLTASAAPDYYDRHPEAKKKRLAFEAMHRSIQSFLALNAVPDAAAFAEYLANNDPTKTKQCVEFLRGLNPGATTYVHRGAALAGTHPFTEAKLDVWAPEEDTSDYYGRLLPLASVDGAAGAAPSSSGAQAARAAPPVIPPPGVDVGAFYQLVDARRNGIGENLLAIDKAANNTSIVFVLRWRGWKLLFAGDAELKSWRTMQANNVLEPVHFLKVAHHGSHNGTPDGEIFDAIVPEKPRDKRKRHAAISTWNDTYSGIPHPPTDARLTARAALHTTLQAPTKLYYDVEFKG
jgi:glyoxylase-like metal-dependent hydrolase (beta-lactamase superfamily II)